MKLQGHETVIIVQVLSHLECVGRRLDTGSQGHIMHECVKLRKQPERISLPLNWADFVFKSLFMHLFILKTYSEHITLVTCFQCFTQYSWILHTCRMSRKRKYALAILWNCSNKLRGRKVKGLYLEVLMELVFRRKR